MNNVSLRDKLMILAAGVVLGLGIAVYLPGEPAYAGTASALEKFSLATCETTTGNSDAVFVLDNTTGRLLGAVYNSQAGDFTARYGRNVAGDFKVKENAKYIMVPGYVNLRSQGAQPAVSGIYVAELTTGSVGLYGFQASNSPRPTEMELMPLAKFNFREN